MEPPVLVVDDLVIDALVPSDAKILAAMADEVVQHVWRVGRQSPEGAAIVIGDSRDAWANDGPIRDLAIRHAGALVGQVTLILKRTDGDPTSDGSLVEIRIARPARGHGIGRRAVRSVLAWATPNLGLSWFEAEIDESNEPSQALFKALGFTCVGRRTVHRRYTATEVLVFRRVVRPDPV